MKLIHLESKEWNQLVQLALKAKCSKVETAQKIHLMELAQQVHKYSEVGRTLMMQKARCTNSLEPILNKFKNSLTLKWMEVQKCKE
jgi:hypothetical protein